LHDYDRGQIEGPLIEQITRLRAAYQLQDVSSHQVSISSDQTSNPIIRVPAFQLSCLKCSQIKTDYLSPTCSCGGAFRGAVSKFDLKRRLQSILSSELSPTVSAVMMLTRPDILVTDYHELDLAGEYASQTLAAW
jgi:DNA polymerase epsilon subunit 1